MKTNSNKSAPAEHFSRDIVRMLKEQYGWTLKKIGQAIDCGESFVSMVGNGKRSLTLDHLSKLEKQLGQPVAILLLKSVDAKNLDKQLKPLYEQVISRTTGKPATKTKRKAAKKTA